MPTTEASPAPHIVCVLPHVVCVLPHDPRWRDLAARESERLTQALGGTIVAVEHFGSTAVPGLAAKPVIDLMPIVTDLDELVEDLGYQWHGEFELPGRRFCTHDGQDGTRLFHLHFYERGAPLIARHLIFRDYLRAHPAAARAYEAEKRRAGALYSDDSLAYNREKAAWVTREEAKALAWHAARQA
jgi:GrpB-like predicted nucleotidyltransferase (UPF0157 family)